MLTFIAQHNPAGSAPIVRYLDGAEYHSSDIISFTNLSYLEILIGCLDKFYQFRDHSEVKNYIRHNSLLVNVLLEALAKIRSYFGEDSQIALEVVCDPEDGDTKLFAFILTSLSAQDALTQRDRMDEDWWLEASYRAQGKLIIDVEFI